jgi:hypothetical protein
MLAAEKGELWCFPEGIKWKGKVGEGWNWCTSVCWRGWKWKVTTHTSSSYEISPLADSVIHRNVNLPCCIPTTVGTRTWTGVHFVTNAITYTKQTSLIWGGTRLWRLIKRTDQNVYKIEGRENKIIIIIITNTFSVTATIYLLFFVS